MSLEFYHNDRVQRNLGIRHNTILLDSLKIIASAKDLRGFWEPCPSSEYQEHGLKTEADPEMKQMF